MTKEFKIIIRGFEVDVYNAKILGTVISYAFADLFTIDEKKNATSKTIKLPGTARNKIFFGFPSDFNSKPNIDQIEVPDAQITADGIQILVGVSKLMNTSVETVDQIEEYELIIQGDNGDWRRKLNGKKLSDLDYSDQNHYLTYANQLASETVAAGREYVYDLIDRGFFQKPNNTQPLMPYYSWLPNDVTEFVTENSRFPALNIVGLMKRIFLGIGYTIDSSLITDADFEKLYWIFIEERLRHPDSFNALQLFHATSLSYTTFNKITCSYQATNSPEVMIYFVIEDSDPSNNFSNGTHYKCPTNAKFNFRATLGIASVQGTVGTTGTVYCSFRRAFDSSIITQKSIPYGTFGNVTVESGLIDMQFGEAVYVTVSLYIDAIATNFNIIKVLAGSTFELLEVSGVADVHYGQLVDMTANLPSVVTQMEFLQGLKGMGNWVFLTDLNNRKVIIERWDDFFRSDAIDMSTKLDNKKQITTKFIGDSHSKIIQYRFIADSNDKFVSEWERQNNIPFGSCNEVNSNAYAKDGIEVFQNNLFAATWMDVCESIGLTKDQIPRMWSDIVRPKRSTAFKPRILYYNGVKATTSSPGIIYFWDQSVLPNGNALHYRTNFPQFFSFDDSVENNNNQLYCDTDLSHGLFQKNFRNTHKNICEGRIWSAFFNLNDLFISNLDFRYQWYIEQQGNGSYFIVNEIKNYNGNEREVTEVELLKVVSNVSKVKLRRVKNKTLPPNSFRPPINPASFEIINVIPVGVNMGRSEVPYQSARMNGNEIFQVNGNEVRVGGGNVFIEEGGNVEQIFIEDSNGDIKPVIL